MGNRRRRRRVGRRARFRKYRLIISYVLRALPRAYAHVIAAAPRREDHARTRRK